MASIAYFLELNKKILKERATEVLKFWVNEDEKNEEKIRSIGPRPRDEKLHTSEWSKLERDKRTIGNHIWDAKILISTIDSSTENTMKMSSDQLRWFFPELAPEDFDLIHLQ
jgi:hypothetical protein